MTDDCVGCEPLLSAWIDGELSDRERGVVAAHLQGCVRCRQDVAGLRVTRGMLSSMPVRRLPADVSSRLRPAGRRRPLGLAAPAGPPRRRRVGGAGLEAAPGRPTGREGRVRRVVARAAATAVAAVSLLGATAFALGGQPEPTERVVAVPVEVFVADHLVRAVGGPVSTPVLYEGRP